MRPASEEPGFLSVSDLHLGYWAERNTAYSAAEKGRAFRAMIEYGVRRRMGRVLLNGDTFDDRKPRTRQWRADARAVREGLEAFGGEVTVLPGNHDPNLRDGLLRGRLGKTVHASGATALMRGDVLATHGHVLETARIWELLDTVGREDPDALHRAVDSDDMLQEELKHCDSFNKRLESWEALSDGMRRAGERVVNAVRRCREYLARRLTGQLDLPTIGAAAQLGHAGDGWGAVFGHTHYPGVFRRELHDPATGSVKAVVVGNSGSFIHEGEPLTCLYVEPALRRMTLLGYDPATCSVLPLQTADHEAAA